MKSDIETNSSKKLSDCCSYSPGIYNEDLSNKINNKNKEIRSEGIIDSGSATNHITKPNLENECFGGTNLQELGRAEPLLSVDICSDTEGPTEGIIRLEVKNLSILLIKIKNYSRSTYDHQFIKEVRSF